MEGSTSPGIFITPDVGLENAFRSPQVLLVSLSPFKTSAWRPEGSLALPALPCPAVKAGVWVHSFWGVWLFKFPRSLGLPIFSYSIYHLSSSPFLQKQFLEMIFLVFLDDTGGSTWLERRVSRPPRAWLNLSGPTLPKGPTKGLHQEPCDAICRFHHAHEWEENPDTTQRAHPWLRWFFFYYNSENSSFLQCSQLIPHLNAAGKGLKRKKMFCCWSLLWFDTDASCL